MNYWDGENWLDVIKNNISISYYLNGNLHRKDGPALVEYDDGNIKFEEYYINGELHREDGPAFISYNHNGIIEDEAYFINGKRNRENGPSVIFRENNNIIKKAYFINEHLHCNYGPAIVWYDVFGNIEKEEYYYYDINFNPHRLPFKLPIDTKEKEFLLKLLYKE